MGMQLRRWQMTSDFALVLTNELLWTAILIVAPVLGFSTLVGLLISIFQVVTQIQEMSLTFVPKLITVALTLIVFGSWMLDILLNYATALIANIPQYF